MAGGYTILGRVFQPHQLAIATLGSAGLLVFALTGGKKAESTTMPPINASSPEEEDFVKTWLKSLEAEEKKPAH
ncbi:hypothetical protein V1512DRAFT_267331 [Lipomyces arxii]|uniref:uncharacterized protein n=1 Tax=Lipomyces arxii TaxID=56418 RepID=UPI0034CDFFD2